MGGVPGADWKLRRGLWPRKRPRVAPAGRGRAICGCASRAGRKRALSSSSGHVYKCTGRRRPPACRPRARCAATRHCLGSAASAGDAALRQVWGTCVKHSSSGTATDGSSGPHRDVTRKSHVARAHDWRVLASRSAAFRPSRRRHPDATPRAATLPASTCVFAVGGCFRNLPGPSRAYSAWGPTTARTSRTPQCKDDNSLLISSLVIAIPRSASTRRMPLCAPSTGVRPPVRPIRGGRERSNGPTKEKTEAQSTSISPTVRKRKAPRTTRARRCVESHACRRTDAVLTPSGETARLCGVRSVNGGGRRPSDRFVPDFGNPKTGVGKWCQDCRHLMSPLVTRLGARRGSLAMRPASQVPSAQGQSRPRADLEDGSKVRAGRPGPGVRPERCAWECAPTRAEHGAPLREPLCARQRGTLH